MFFYQKNLIVLLVPFMAVALSGCGEKAGTVASSTRAEQSETCIECHDSVRSPVTAKLIVEEWKLSAHNLNNFAGCADCHEPEAGHPTSCNLCHGGTPSGSTISSVTHNPDASGKCAKCHTRNAGYPTEAIQRSHFANVSYPATFGGYTASYVSTNYVRNCRKCHDPHNPTSNIAYNRAWAESGHGEVNVGARTSRDFKLFGTTQPANLAYTNSSPGPSSPPTTDPAVIATGTPVCVRCHTTTGYINFVNSGFMSLKPFGSNTDKTKEVTGCDACHSDYSFKLRAVPRVTIYYNFSGATQASVGNPYGHAKIQNYSVTFPDLGSSNMCLPCHAGRGIGSQIKLLSNMGVDFTNINNPSSHDFSGAAILTAKSGYEFAGKEYTTGIGAYTGHDSTGLSSGKGPCITCHLNKVVKSDSHTFKPVIHDTAQFPLYTANRTWSQVYSVSSASPASLKILSITSLSCNTSGCHVNLSAAELSNDKEGYISALAVLNKWARLVRYVPVKPQLAFDATTNKARSTTQWNFLGPNTGPDLMGATFNLSTLNNEPGAYTHNPLYAKRLVYDSIYFLCTKATDHALGINQYPTDEQFNVADAIHYLTITTARTLETVSGVSNTAVTATISTQQADAAIKWLYGKAWSSLSASDKLKRPGDN
jgi:hypothetical protein